MSAAMKKLTEQKKKSLESAAMKKMKAQLASQKKSVEIKESEKPVGKKTIQRPKLSQEAKQTLLKNVVSVSQQTNGVSTNNNQKVEQQPATVTPTTQSEQQNTNSVAPAPKMRKIKINRKRLLSTVTSEQPTKKPKSEEIESSEKKVEKPTPQPVVSSSPPTKPQAKTPSPQVKDTTTSESIPQEITEDALETLPDYEDDDSELAEIDRLLAETC